MSSENLRHVLYNIDFLIKSFSGLIKILEKNDIVTKNVIEECESKFDIIKTKFYIIEKNINYLLYSLDSINIIESLSYIDKDFPDNSILKLKENYIKKMKNFMGDAVTVMHDINLVHTDIYNKYKELC